ncbi:MAG: hypothetical protein DVB22_001411 [Verrucomicrobia bacterium]|jgi:hypothetical protein|nr:MAG: hypothetical protein DVB22_001411 [Verrucomicrobiota bacterium]
MLSEGKSLDVSEKLQLRREVAIRGRPDCYLGDYPARMRRKTGVYFGGHVRGEVMKSGGGTGGEIEFSVQR